MTPKEKANELLNKFNFEHKDKKYTIFQTPEESIRCALILCDEFVNDWIIRFDELKQEQNLNITIDEMLEKSKTVKFWQQVKQEILNL